MSETAELVIAPEQAKVVGRELEVRVSSLADRMAAVSVLDQASCAQAVADRQELGQAIKRVHEFFAPLKSMAHKLHRALCDRESEIISPLERVDGLLRAGVSAWKAEVDRTRQEQERVLAEARRREEQDRVAAEAAHFETVGEPEMARAVLEQALTTPTTAVVLPDQTKAVDGLKFIRRWKWRFVRHDETYAMTQIPRVYLCPDTVKLNRVVSAGKGSIQIPGIEQYYVDDPVR